MPQRLLIAYSLIVALMAAIGFVLLVFRLRNRDRKRQARGQSGSNRTRWWWRV